MKKNTLISGLLTVAGLHGVRLRGFDDAGGDEFGQEVVDVDLTKVVLWSDDLRSCKDTKTIHHQAETFFKLFRRNPSLVQRGQRGRRISPCGLKGTGF